ncbi:MAG TPA: protein phosphatase 2C domain-containing protein [Aestuariivirga sp.]|nr:protein phosphatase 2C domain-containing protein [Aestuariivirga sp.]
MKLAGAVTQGSGAINEDGWGCLGGDDDVSAAWIFDGVTGINGQNFLGHGTDAAWLVAKAHDHLRALAGLDLPLHEILSKLVQALIVDFNAATKNLNIPEDYDPPAACLTMVKRYGGTWQGLRLGDSCLLARGSDGAHISVAASPNNAFDHWLSKEALKRRDAGMLDIKELLAEFRPQLLRGRKSRNSPGGYSILEASPSAMEFAEYFDLGTPQDVLLCTDGYYRAVDYYALHSEESLLEASLSSGGVDKVLNSIRSVEASDPACLKYLRFKPADDATAVALRKRV